jgi:hypothetical protein
MDERTLNERKVYSHGLRKSMRGGDAATFAPSKLTPPQIFNGNLRRAFGILDAVQAVNLRRLKNEFGGRPPRAFEAASPAETESRPEGVRPERWKCRPGLPAAGPPTIPTNFSTAGAVRMFSGQLKERN